MKNIKIKNFNISIFEYHHNISETEISILKISYNKKSIAFFSIVKHYYLTNIYFCFIKFY